MKTVSISLDDEPLPEDVRATVHTMEGEHARPEDVGKRWISLDVGGAVSITFPEYDGQCARRALAIASALTRAAFEILEPPRPATSKENQVDQLKDDDIPF